MPTIKDLWLVVRYIKSRQYRKANYVHYSKTEKEVETILDFLYFYGESIVCG